jgi:arginine exporter protein ArgO
VTPAGVTGALVTGAVAGLGIAVPVGAVGVYLVSLATRRPARVAVCAALGVASADAVYAALAVAAGGAVARLTAPVAGGLRVVATAALVVVGVALAVDAVRTWRSGPAGLAPQRDASAARAYVSLLALTLANPATVVYFVAVMAGGPGSLAAGGAAATAFVVGVLGASAAWQLGLLIGGRAVGAVAAGARGRLATGLLGSALVLALAVRTAAG